MPAEISEHARGEEVMHDTDGHLVDASQSAEVITSDGKPANVMLTQKRSRTMTLPLGSDCVDCDAYGEKCDDRRGKIACKYRTRSMVWDHVTRLPFGEGEQPKAICNYCKKKFPCDTSKNGTGHMKNHLEYKCHKAPEHIKKSDPLQKVLTNGLGSLSSTAYNPELSRVALAEMIIIDELPFKFVEGEGFRKLCASLQPKFSVPSRQTITRDVMKLYDQEKSNLMKKLKGYRLCLTTDTWTSVQNVNYMSLTAHYIDSDWVYNKKILNFSLVESHKGEVLGKVVEACLVHWGIQSIFTITVDNASSNNGLIAHLKKRTKSWNDIILDHEFIHVRCVAHILNLVVSEGLKEVSVSVDKIRNAVRYVRSSPSRLSGFKKAALKNRIMSSQLLCLDVPTRWNSTYLMLSAAIRYKKAFDSLEDDDLGYKLYFAEDDDSCELRDGRTKRIGPPKVEDFVVAESLVQFLQIFYDATLKLSGSSYVTAHSCFPELALIQNTLNMHVNSSDAMLSSMAKSMKIKFDKYWANTSKTNLLLYITVVLDPRRKLSYLRFCFKKLMDEVSVNELFFLVHDAVTRVFMWFLGNSDTSSTAGNDGGIVECGVNPIGLSLSCDSLEAEFKRELEMETNAKGTKTELEQYLEDACLVGGDNFDILTWWKLNACRYPVVSQIAHQLLALPVSTVASESCFSTGGRVLDVFRSSLSPDHMEALICTQNWIKEVYVDPKSKKDMELYDAHEYISTIEELGNDFASNLTNK